MIELNEDFRVHLSHYLILFILMVFGFGTFLFFSFHSRIQIIILLLTSGSYVIWGIIHHWLCEDLHLKVVIEYLLIALLADLILFSLLLRA